MGAFDGGRLTSDSGVLLLREADRLFDVTGRPAACFADYRDPERVEHPLQTLIAQRVLGLAAGYEDLNDHDRLRDDSALAVASGCDDMTGGQRLRERDRGHALAGSSTLNRLELGEPEQAQCDRYKKILADDRMIDTLLVDLFLDSERRPPAQVVLDRDATDDPLHGNQEAAFSTATTAITVTCRCIPLVASTCCAAGCGAPTATPATGQWGTEAVVAQIRQRWPQTKILVRGDSGFCREPIMVWCEGNGVDYVLGLARNARLQRLRQQRGPPQSRRSL